jgi:exonuclease III
VALCEFRATPPSRALSARLADLGLRHQLSTADPTVPNLNCLLVASRWPIEIMRDRRAPNERGRWLLAGVAAPRPFALGAMHVPNRVSGRKWPFLDAVLAVAERWRGGPAVLLGDTNSGRPGIDEESSAFNQREGAWIDGLARAGWQDAFRHLRGAARAYTWYSPNGGNGFRIDQAFLNPALLPSLVRARYTWGIRERDGRPRFALSDHAALVLDLE